MKRNVIVMFFLAALALAGQSSMHGQEVPPQIIVFSPPGDHGFTGDVEISSKESFHIKLKPGQYAALFLGFEQGEKFVATSSQLQASRAELNLDDFQYGQMRYFRVEATAASITLAEWHPSKDECLPNDLERISLGPSTDIKDAQGHFVDMNGIFRRVKCMVQK